MVVHEEKQPKCNSSSGGVSRSSSSKKNKPKKIPQRGLGVAQLEKIRLEEQQKNNNNAAGSSSDPFLKSSVPISSAVDFFSPTPLSALGSSTMVTAATGSTGHRFFPLLWNAMEQSSHDAAAAETVASKFTFHATLPGDSSNSNLGWQSTTLLQRRQEQQPPPVQWVDNMLSPSSSGVNLQMEPPSNQSYSSNYIMPSSWQEDLGMVGTKRPWPFQPDAMSGHTSFPCKIPPFTSPFLKPDESMRMYRNDPIKFESKSTGFRDDASSSSLYQTDWRNSDLRTDKRIKENGAAMDDGFLSLGPSLTQQSIPRPKQPMVIPPSHHSEHPEFSLLPSHGGVVGDAISQSQGSLQQPFYSFLPMGPTDCQTTLNERSGEASHGVDLNLKL